MMSDEKVWKWAKELRGNGVPIRDIRDKIGYKGTIKSLIKLCDSPEPQELKQKTQMHDGIQRMKDEIFNYFGNRCNRCGFDDKRALQIDHVNGGGAREIKAIGNYRMRKNLIKRINAGDNIKDYQLLCANCNWIKRHENDETVRNKHIQD